MNLTADPEILIHKIGFDQKGVQCALCSWTPPLLTQDGYPCLQNPLNFTFATDTFIGRMYEQCCCHQLRQVKYFFNKNETVLNITGLCLIHNSEWLDTGPLV
jgi:hypothetical protein